MCKYNQNLDIFLEGQGVEEAVQDKPEEDSGLITVALPDLPNPPEQPRSFGKYSF